jgi:nucleoside 2-deoxyribosyltransferase
MGKVYVASGWFTPEQEEVRLRILGCLSSEGYDYYSPKDHCLYTPGGDITARQAFNENLDRIEEAEFIIASTEGKDMGTLFECGYAFSAGVPIVYFWEGDGAFNLMLSESASYVAKDVDSLMHALRVYSKKQLFPQSIQVERVE